MLIGCYFPPDVATSKSMELTDFLVKSIDDFLSVHPDSHVIIGGDLNRFCICDVVCHCELVNMLGGATYGGSQLDFILMSEEISKYYTDCTAAPFDNSIVPHFSLYSSSSKSFF